MTGSGSNGWNGNILGVKQGKSIVGVFGETFMLSAPNVPTSINVVDNLVT